MISNSNTMHTVQIYTDGSTIGNPGPGGCAAILTQGTRQKVVTSGEPNTTNSRMEILAVIIGLQALKRTCSVTIFSDSQYVVNAFNKGWLTNWKHSGWKKADGSNVANVDLWESLYNLTTQHRVTFKWVRGHAGNLGNEQCDIYAKEAARAFMGRCR